MTLQEILNRDNTFKYQLLSRLFCDYNYFLGNGNGNPKHLWANSVQEQFEYMKAIYNSFSSSEKPKWLSLKKIYSLNRRAENKFIERYGEKNDI